jgi:uncharacterized protein (DUF433 family)
MDWSDYPLAEVIPEKVSGTPLFKDTRLPVSAVVENVDAFIAIEGMSLDEAVIATLECYPETPGGADGIRAVLAYRAAHEPQLQP